MKQAIYHLLRKTSGRKNFWASRIAIYWLIPAKHDWHEE
jgi:hypothetical protein